jgi:hypothetical protein
VAWDLRRSAEDGISGGLSAEECARRHARALELLELNLGLDPANSIDRLSRARTLSGLARIESRAAPERARSHWESALSAWRALAAEGLAPPSERGRVEEAEAALASS